MLKFTGCFAILIVVVAQNCQHPIFCQGDVLKAVQLSGLLPDGKTFVDMPLKYDIDKTLQNFKQQPVDQFLNDNFLDPETVLDIAEIPDWIPQPEAFKRISDPALLKFAQALHLKWKGLAKKFSLDKLKSVSQCRNNCTTILESLDQKLFIAPGGRFRECYYWDTYWIIRALTRTNLTKTAEGIVRNFMQVIQQYGYIPNGMRIYYEGRSQPPLLALMLSDLTSVVPNRQLEQEALPILVKEHKYWMDTHSKQIKIHNKTYTVNIYNANTSSPRPESYKQDYMLTVNMTEEEKYKVIKSVASAAESGWDFSTRWFRNDSMKSIRTVDIVPSDLNAFIGMMERYIQELAIKFDEKELATQMQERIKQRQEYFEAIEQAGIYPDQTTEGAPTEGFYPSMLVPLIFLNKTVSFRFLQPVAPVASFTNSGQQWDYPNVWAPNVWILHQTQTNKLEIANRWIRAVYCGWKKHGAMFQKYHAEQVGERGSGGEYVPQEGFGWTNGLTLELITTYADKLMVPKC